MDEILKVAASIGPSGLAAGAVLMVLTGWLVPRRTHDAIVKARDEEVAYLRRAHDAQSALADKLMVSAELQRSVLGALPAPPTGHPSSDGHG